MKVDIVMATYNGSKFIKEQLLSIISDDCFNSIDNIIISDDHSTDNTLKIIHDFFKIKKIENYSIYLNQRSKGPASNFIHGLEFSTADFIFFCDQDDIWVSNRISLFIESAKLLNKKKPGLVYSDLEVVDCKLNIIHSSFLRHEEISADWGMSIENLFFQNSSPGCAMLINKECKQKLLSTFESEHVLMHDWWAMLYSALYKNQIFVHGRTIQYRQHESNTVGMTKKITYKNVILKVKKNISNLSLVRKQSLYFFNTLKHDEVKLLSLRALNLIKLETTKTSMIKRLQLVRYKRIKSTFLKSFITKLIIIIKG